MTMAGVAIALRPAVWALHCLLGRPRDSVLAIVVACSVGAIAVNGLMLQRGPHPAPIFAQSVANPPAASRADVLIRRDNEFVPVASVAGAPPPQRRASGDESIGALPAMLPRARPAAAPPKAQSAAGRTAAARKDPIAEILAPPQSVASAPSPVASPAASAQGSSQLAAIQRTLSAYGYGQVAPTGTMGPETRAAIEQFERERRMPVTGRVSDRLVRELAAVTGKPL